MAAVTRIAALIPVAVLVLLAYFAAQPDEADAADTGFKSPTGIVAPTEWLNPIAAFVSDNVYAIGSGNDNVITGDRQAYSSFGLGVPDGAVIDGIEVRVEASCSCVHFGVDLSGDNGASFSQFRTLSPIAGEVVTTLGGPTDLWGLGWTRLRSVTRTSYLRRGCRLSWVSRALITSR